MDHFGIGQAMKGMAHVFFTTSRRTGRTHSLLDSMKDGDRICCATVQETKHLLRHCQERGLQVECITVNPDSPHRLMELGTSQGRTVFDHTWIERFYLNALAQCQQDIDKFQTRLSGEGEAHRETRRRAVEMAHWRL